jgi:hypothetical protein
LRVVEEEDDLGELIGREVIINWRGLTPSVLRKIVDMKHYPDTEVPYGADDAAELIRKAHGLEEWILFTSTNLEVFCRLLGYSLSTARDALN